MTFDINDFGGASQQTSAVRLTLQYDKTVETITTSYAEANRQYDDWMAFATDLDSSAQPCWDQGTHKRIIVGASISLGGRVVREEWRKVRLLLDR